MSGNGRDKSRCVFSWDCSVCTICCCSHAHRCTHTHRSHHWSHPQEKELSCGGAEFAAQTRTPTHTHTERLSPHWLTSLHPTAGVSEGSAAALCSRGLETLEWAFFSPLTSILGCISTVLSLAHFPPFFNILVPSVDCLLSFTAFTADGNSSKAWNSQRQYDTTETTGICAIKEGRINRASTAGPRGSNPVLSQPCRLRPQLKEFGKGPSCSPSPIQTETYLLSGNQRFSRPKFLLISSKSQRFSLTFDQCTTLFICVA